MLFKYSYANMMATLRELREIFDWLRWDSQPTYQERLDNGDCDE